MANNFNDMGENAESIVSLLMNRKLPQQLFRVKFLGDKWPTIDFYVELTNKKGCYFFVQVKSSTRGYIKVGTRKTNLILSVKKKSVIENLNYYGPTYLIGVDYVKTDFFKSKAFIYCLSGDPNTANTISQIPVKSPLTPPKLKLLEKEVSDFWKNSNISPNKIALISKFGL